VDDRRSKAVAHGIRGDRQWERVFVSAVVAFEITNKVRSGKWPEADLLVRRFFDVMARYHFLPLPITLEHTHLAGSLPGTHRDPFDRMLAA
jgi:PIN domain nuclease of toxin-antitoxin system